ncbi:hypothetical protein CDCA_CDCA10G2883 [Cyanidium caldarium]|uniref:Uncharacterized protein n=1 Tax=Cyanidium caldarium TaxID=2771 RepID=A0AAV9IXN8_CYACA|nr:hypothetical protein CDCA_CDCA10G2883 [Cyanidium caldarium]
MRSDGAAVAAVLTRGTGKRALGSEAAPARAVAAETQGKRPARGPSTGKRASATDTSRKQPATAASRAKRTAAAETREGQSATVASTSKSASARETRERQAARTTSRRARPSATGASKRQAARVTSRGTERLHEKASSSGPQYPVTLLVHAVHHYVQDRPYRIFLGDVNVDAAGLDADAFDVTLYHPEERLKTKVCLHPSLNSLVHRGELRRNATLRIIRWTRRYSENRGVNLHRVLLVRMCQVMAPPADVPPNAAPVELEWTPAADALEKAFGIPLASSRKMYVGPGALDALPVDPRWRSQSGADEVPVSGLDQLDVTGDHFSLSQVRLRDPSGPFIGRILRKTSLWLWPKPNDIRQGMPIKFEMDIGDGRSAVRVVVWNAACRRFFDRLWPGDLLALLNVKVRGQELHVNASSPQGIVVRLEQDARIGKLFGPIRELGGDVCPALLHACVPLTDLDVLEDEALFAFAGVVTFVSPLYRERFVSLPGGEVANWVGEGDHASGFCFFRKYRIVLLRDGSEARDLRVRLYENSQRDAFDAACVPGAVVLLTELRKKHLCVSDFEGITSMEVSSTPWTTIYCLQTAASAAGTDKDTSTAAAARIPFYVYDSAPVRRLLRLVAGTRQSDGVGVASAPNALNENAVQHSTFRVPDTLEQYARMQERPGALEGMRLEFDRLGAVADTLHLREARTVLVCGTMVDMSAATVQRLRNEMRAQLASECGRALFPVEAEEATALRLTSLNHRGKSIVVLVLPARDAFGSGVAQHYDAVAGVLAHFGAALRERLKGGDGLAALRECRVAALLTLVRTRPTEVMHLLHAAMPLSEAASDPFLTEDAES